MLAGGSVNSLALYLPAISWMAASTLVMLSAGMR